MIHVTAPYTFQRSVDRKMGILASIKSPFKVITVDCCTSSISTMNSTRGKYKRSVENRYRWSCRMHKYARKTCIAAVMQNHSTPRVLSSLNVRSWLRARLLIAILPKNESDVMKCRFTGTRNIRICNPHFGFCTMLALLATLRSKWESFKMLPTEWNKHCKVQNSEPNCLSL